MKYFVISDIHSFYDEMIKSLDQVHYDRDNPNHILIVCGDLFDRGSKSLEVYEYIRSIPKERRVLIIGNHEYLLREIVKRKYFIQIDVSNGTFDSVLHLTSYPDRYEAVSHQEEIIEQFDKMKILDWIFESGEWCNYYELDRFVFVHSFIPVINENNFNYYSTPAKLFKPDINWRNASSKAYETATWGCPYELMDAGLFPDKDKILVCGHFHTISFHNHYSNNPRTKLTNTDYIDGNHQIFYNDKMIALDSCTVISQMINVLVIDEDYNCYDQFGNKLLIKKE